MSLEAGECRLQIYVNFRVDTYSPPHRLRLAYSTAVISERPVDIPTTNIPSQMRMLSGQGRLSGATEV